MTILQRLCPKCMKMIPNIFNGIPFPCPQLQGYSACQFGLRLTTEEQKRMAASPKANNHNLEKYRDDSK